MDHPSIALHGLTTIAGRYVIGADQRPLPGINLFACRLSMISSDALITAAPVIPPPGEAIQASFGPFGTMTGRIRRQTEDGFEMSIEQTPRQRTNLNTKITAFSEKLWTGPSDRRNARRMMPHNPRSVISRPDNWSQPCLIVDYSTSGAALSAGYQPAIGEVVTVGKVTGEVTRLFDIGFAVRFFEPQAPDTVETLLGAPDEWRQAVGGRR